MLEEHEEVGETAQRVTIALKPPRARVQAACRCPDRCERSDLSDQPASRLVAGIANAQRATDIFCAIREHANAHDAKRDRAGKRIGRCCYGQRSLIVRMETGRGHGGTAGARKLFRLGLPLGMRPPQGVCRAPCGILLPLGPFSSRRTPTAPVLGCSTGIPRIS